MPIEPIAKQQGHIAYRPDIDGLRAVAVVPVVIFHLFHETFAGGYLGVDIFFVISGYLITAILVKDCLAGEYSIARFYERRIRRIIPALLFVLVVVSIACSIMFLPSDLVGYGKSVIATLVFASNIYFWRDTNYFAADAATKPLLHTWSLGIEEQFYIFFPLIVFFFLRRWRESVLLWFIAILSVISYLGCVVAMNANLFLPAFYLLPTRAWELGLGAMACLIGRKVSPGERSGPVLMWLGMAVVAVSLWTLAPTDLSPLPAGSFLCVGAALMLWSGSVSSPVSRFLSLRPLVAVGLISYSLYLWHWPVYVLARYYLVRETTFLESSALAAISVALAWFSWRFVERPFRKRSMAIGRVLSLNAVPLGALSALVAMMLVTAGIPGRYDARAASLNRNVGDIYKCPVTSVTLVEDTHACNINGGVSSGKPVRAALMGNSHALMYVPAFEEALKQRGEPGLLFYSNGCIPTLGVNRTARCVSSQQTNIEAIAKSETIEVVFISFAWGGLRTPMYDPEGRNLGIVPMQELLDRIGEVITLFRGAGKSVVLVGPIPDPNYDVASIASREMAFRGEVRAPLSQPRAEFEEEFGGVERWLDSLKGVRIIRPATRMCDASKCRFTIDGRIAFADDNHLSRPIARQFADLFSEALSETEAETASPSAGFAGD